MAKKNSAKREKFFSKERFVSPIVMWTLIFSGVVIFVSSIPDYQLLPVGYVSVIIFLVGFIYWLFLTFNALYIHPRAAVSVAGIKYIVRKGTYSRMRHPFYTADIILAIGIFFLFPTVAVLISVFWAIAIWILWMKLEEKYLERKFGKVYLDYKKQVPMIIPRFIQE